MKVMKRMRQRTMAAIYRPLIRRHDRFIDSYKQDLFRPVNGRVVELGPGPGSNLQYLNKVDHWLGIEPNPFMHPMVDRQLAKCAVTGKVIDASAESIPVEDSCAAKEKK